jgi:hypothetical protein
MEAWEKGGCMDIIRIENDCDNTAEIEMRAGDTSRVDYLPGREETDFGPWQTYAIRKAEQGGLRLSLRLLDTDIRVEMYRLSQDATRRQRPLSGSRIRRMRLHSDETLLLVPVGQFAD